MRTTLRLVAPGGAALVLRGPEEDEPVEPAAASYGGFPAIANLTAITPRTVFMDVVGVIREMKLQSLTQEDEFVGAVYFPVLQALPPPQAGFGLNYAVRTAGDPAAVTSALRQTIASLDRELALYDVLPMTERVDRSRSIWRARSARFRSRLERVRTLMSR